MVAGLDEKREGARYREPERIDERGRGALALYGG